MQYLDNHKRQADSTVIEVSNLRIADRIPLVVILGPTAVGKTEIAIQLAQSQKGEIISADSRLFYRGMDIGTAKPSRAERDGVPHHLIDIADVNENVSLAVFQAAAHQAIADVHQRGNLPFLVGGTGQYMRAVIDGWDIPKQEPDPALRLVLETWGRKLGAAEIHQRLAILDPQAAALIEPNNLRRTVRALEVIFHTGKRFSQQRQRGSSPYHTYQVGLIRPRTELYARIDARIAAMLQAGFVEEVRTLLEAGYHPDLPSMTAIGYRQIAAYLQGKLSLEEAVMLIKRLSRQFVRRQANWFKLDDPNIHWFQIEPGTLDVIADQIRMFSGILPSES